MNNYDELRIVGNFLDNMTKAYRQRNMNWVVVQDILMRGTSTAGSTSCKAKCGELGIDPWGYSLDREVEIVEETYNPDTHDKIIKIIAEQLSCDREEISIDDEVGTLEIDSLDLVEIKMAIDSEFEFNYNYELDYFNNNMTVGEIIEIVKQKVKSK